MLKVLEGVPSEPKGGGRDEYLPSTDVPIFSPAEVAGSLSGVMWGLFSGFFIFSGSSDSGH